MPIKMNLLLFLTLFVTIAAKCPPTATEALYDTNRKALVECNAKTLRDYYHEDDCCIVNLAECNNIAAAWELRRNVLDSKPLCPKTHPKIFKSTDKKFKEKI